MKFRTVLCDPPWEYRTWSPLGNRAEDHYPTQGTAWIESLDVDAICDRNCTLLLWATNPLLPEALGVMKRWRFEFKSMLTWVKMTAAACPRIGLGYHARACTEQLLIGSRGNAPAPPVERRPNGVVLCPRGEHSAKPEFQYEIAEGYPGPYLEMFHRPRGGALFGPRENWTFIGNEVDGLDIRDALSRLAEKRLELAA